MSIISDTKEVIELIQKVDNADLYRKIIDLSGEIYELHGEHMEALQCIRELEDQLKKQHNMKFNATNGNYYEEGDEVPFCATCWENDGKAIHQSYDREFGYHCEVCVLNRAKAQSR